MSDMWKGQLRNKLSQSTFNTTCHSRSTNAVYISSSTATSPDDDRYKYSFLIGAIFFKYIKVVPLRDQSASMAVDALLNHWIMYHGNRSVLFIVGSRI